MKLLFDFYGVVLEINSSDRKIMENLKRDFSFFLTKERISPEITISLQFGEIPHLKPASYPLKANLYKENVICFDNGVKRYIDYEGKALAVYDFARKNAVIYSSEWELLYELGYLFSLSRVGEELDRKGFHRIHALGISYQGKGYLVLLPPGGGKTTLALRLLEEEGIKLLSEDTPLISSNLKLFPFPLRIGVREGEVGEGIPGKYLRKFKRRGRDTKILIDLEFFRERVSPPCPLRGLFIGERVFQSYVAINKMSKISLLFPMLVHFVVGWGLPQLIELTVRKGIGTMINMEILRKRLLLACRIIHNVESYQFLMGRNIERNIRYFVNFLKAL